MALLEKARGALSRRFMSVDDAAAFPKVGFTALLLIIAACVSLSGVGEGWERGFHAWRDTVRRHPTTGRTVFVEIDARSLRRLDHWPFARGVYAKAIANIERAGAASLAFDVDFSSRSDPREDALMAAAVAKSRMPIILAAFTQTSSQLGGELVENAPIPELRSRVMLGSVNFRQDADGLIRYAPFGTVIGGIARPSVASLLTNVSGRSGASFPIDGALAPASVPRLSFADVVDGRIPPGALRDKYVLIGASAIEMGDRYLVPNYGYLPGALLHVLAAETLLAGSAPTNLGPLGAVVVALTGFFLSLNLSGLRRHLAIGGLVAALFAYPFLMEAASLGSPEVLAALIALAATGGAVQLYETLAALRISAARDAETGLLNLRALNARLATAKEGALMVVRILNYGDVLGVLGQDAATALVVQIAERIRPSAPHVYRIDGNALAWIAPDAEVSTFALLIGELSAVLSEPVTVGQREIACVYTYGVRRIEGGSGADAVGKALLAAAGAEAKGLIWEIYTDDLDRRIDWRLAVARDLDDAMASGDLWTAYQPKLDVATGEVTCVEALARWLHPTRGQLSPDAFIPLVEDAGRIADLTLFVLRRSLEDQAQWRAKGLSLGVAVNVSAHLPSNDAFVSAVQSLTRAFNVRPGDLTLEITESAPLINPEAAIAGLNRLAALGAAISIDDYGTGQSTLSYLKRLPASEIKIDKGFVTDLTSSRSDQAMVRSSVALAHELGLKVVAEGVETEAVLDLLVEAGCDYAQGWLIGRPVAADELFDRVLAARPWRRSGSAVTAQAA